MTFWLEKEWQRRAGRRIEAELHAVSRDLLPKNLRNGEWTTPILQGLARASLDVCREAGASPVCRLGPQLDHDCGSARLYDFSCWLENNDEFFGLPIAAESEWSFWKPVLYDFDKLTQARAGLRVMIFQFHERDTPDSWQAALMNRAAKFNPKPTDDAWLLACWKGGQFECWSNVWE